MSVMNCTFASNDVRSVRAGTSITGPVRPISPAQARPSGTSASRRPRDVSRLGGWHRVFGVDSEWIPEPRPVSGQPSIVDDRSRECGLCASNCAARLPRGEEVFDEVDVQRTEQDVR